MAKVYECVDGFVARGDDDDQLMAQIERRVVEAHPHLVGTLDRDEILAAAREV